MFPDIVSLTRMLYYCRVVPIEAPLKSIIAASTSVGGSCSPNTLHSVADTCRMMTHRGSRRGNTLAFQIDLDLKCDIERESSGSSSNAMRLERGYSATKAIVNADKLTVLGVPVNVLTRPQLTDLLGRFLRSDERGWISYVNVHAVNLAQQHPQFLSFLQTSLVNYCDGEGVRLGARILGTRLPERIVMTEWVEDVFRLAQERGFSIFLLGGSEEIVTRASRALTVRYPQARISGYHQGFLTPEGSEHVVETISRSETDILIVGMGMPLQEDWIAEHFDRLNIRVALNAGSCFEYLAGAKRRCPRWMGEHGLEWLFRLIQEPGRLWKRYLLGNPLFLTRILRERVANRERSR